MKKILFSQCFTLKTIILYTYTHASLYVYTHVWLNENRFQSSWGICHPPARHCVLCPPSNAICHRRKSIHIYKENNNNKKNRSISCSTRTCRTSPRNDNNNNNRNDVPGAYFYVFMYIYIYIHYTGKDFFIKTTDFYQYYSKDDLYAVKRVWKSTSSDTTAVFHRKFLKVIFQQSNGHIRYF